MGTETPSYACVLNLYSDTYTDNRYQKTIWLPYVPFNGLYLEESLYFIENGSTIIFKYKIVTVIWDIYRKQFVVQVEISNFHDKMNDYLLQLNWRLDN